jgi:hypothetical protein
MGGVPLSALAGGQTCYRLWRCLQPPQQISEISPLGDLMGSGKAAFL